MVDALASAVLQDRTAGVRQHLAIERGPCPSRAVRRIEPRQLDAEHRGLQLVQSLIEPSLDVLTLAPLSLIAQATAALGDPIVVRADRTAVSKPSQVLAWIEAEGRGISERSGAGTLPAGTMRLGGVLDHEQAVAPSEPPDCVHVADLPVQVDGDHGDGAVRDSLAGGSNVNQPGRIVHVAEPRNRAGVEHGEGGRNVGVGRDDDLVALLHSGRDQGERQRGRPGRHADAMAHAAHFGELGLEPLDLAAQDEPALGEHIVERHSKLIGDRCVLPAEIHEGDLARGSKSRQRVHEDSQCQVGRTGRACRSWPWRPSTDQRARPHPSCRGAARRSYRVTGTAPRSLRPACTARRPR